VSSRSKARRSANAPAAAGRGAPRRDVTSPAGAKAARTTARLPYLAAIGLSAFLLFSLELWAGRKVLPVYGGTAGVWATTLCFFTGILFVGYLYAHLVAPRLGAERGGLVQLGLAVLAAALTALAPSDVASLRIDGAPDALNVLLAVAVIGGPAGFLLATTTPLLSAWFGVRGEDPWWLYAVSNGASFVALALYPFVIEPLVGLAAQRVGLVLLLFGYAVSLALIVRDARGSGAVPKGTSETPDPVPAPRRQLLWLLAAAIPAGLLSATTNVLQTDLVATAFVWVGPLAVYLGSFVVAFSARGRRALPTVDRLVPAAVAILWLPYVQPFDWTPITLLGVELTAFFVIAVAVHGRLATDRPGTTYLTRFYLILSAGGVIATAFVALFAPLAFPDLWEYPILVVGGLVILAVFGGRRLGWLPDVRGEARGIGLDLAWRLVPFAAVAGVLAIATGADFNTNTLGIPLLIGLAAMVVAASPRLLIVVAPLAMAVTLLVLTPGADQVHTLTRVRSFYGVIRIDESGATHAEYSGSTLHGLQFTDKRASIPTTYYTESGPLGAVFTDLRSRAADPSVGVVGLGAGTIAAYAYPGDVMTFFEIDRKAVDLAYDPAFFSYLRGAASLPKIVLGDGRLSLEAEPPASFDLLVLDAFASDAVPAHLLTQEAIRTYTRDLRPGGVIAFHVSNRSYRLAPTIAATARSIGLDAAGLTYAPNADAIRSEAAQPTIWVVVGAQAAIARFAGQGWTQTFADGPVLTDDNPDLFRALLLFGS
jgi:SAM-dependent methyltransferase